MEGSIIAVDLGGTWLRVARYRADGTRQQRLKMATHAEEGAEAVIERVVRGVQAVLPEDGKVEAVGLAMPGPLDPYRGVVIEAPNLPGWERVPIRDRLQEALGLPVYVGNDANLAALGEHRYGAGRGVDDLVYITVSTGVGGGIILDGRLLLGSGGLAGEIGHMVLEPDGPPCTCGRWGCLEALASGTALGRQARELAARGQAEAILRRAGRLEAIDGVAVGEAALQGDPVAQELIRRAGYYLGLAITNLMHLLNPARFVLGGGVTQVGDLLFDAIKATVQERTMGPLYWEGVEIVPAGLGDDVGLLGALALVLSEAKAA
ncbi:MAG: ROK family protein [Chloroflexi bacterium]|nr:MAG: ROK family protein [Chloroflexota bacterium]